MADVSAHSRYSGLLDSLRAEERDRPGRGFKTYRDIMVFAAMVGFEKGVREKSDGKGTTVPLRIFESSKDHNLIWLLALMEHEDVEILRKDEFNDNESSAVAAFEELMNGGLSEISVWLADKSPTDYFATIIERIGRKISAEVAVEDNPVEF